MTLEETINEFGDNADSMCRILCGFCTTNDWYCTGECNSISWVRRNYKKAIERMAGLDGDYIEFFKRVKTWK